MYEKNKINLFFYNLCKIPMFWQGLGNRFKLEEQKL